MNAATVACRQKMIQPEAELKICLRNGKKIWSYVCIWQNVFVFCKVTSRERLW